MDTCESARVMRLEMANDRQHLGMAFVQRCMSFLWLTLVWKKEGDRLRQFGLFMIKKQEEKCQ